MAEHNYSRVLEVLTAEGLSVIDIQLEPAQPITDEFGWHQGYSQTRRVILVPTKDELLDANAQNELVGVAIRRMQMGEEDPIKPEIEEALQSQASRYRDGHTIWIPHKLTPIKIKVSDEGASAPAQYYRRMGPITTTNQSVIDEMGIILPSQGQEEVTERPGLQAIQQTEIIILPHRRLGEAYIAFRQELDSSAHDTDLHGSLLIFGRDIDALGSKESSGIPQIMIDMLARTPDEQGSIEGELRRVVKTAQQDAAIMGRLRVERPDLFTN